jgi:protein O-mannosyl-transferase
MQTFNKQGAAIENRGTFFQPFGYAQGGLYVQVALLLLTVFALYAGSLHAPFVFDDRDFFESPVTLSKYGHTYFSFDLRWLSYSSLAWTVNWFGLDVFWLRLGNVLLHAANAIALFFLLRRLFQVTLVNNDASNGMPPSLVWFAFFGALIFAVHPVSVYGVAYLVERSILMATLFVLLMLLAYLEGILRGGWQWMLAAVLFYFAAVYSKEHSIAAPGIALALTFLIRKPSLALFKLIAPYFILSALIAITMLLSVKGMLGHAYEPQAAGMLELSAKKQGLTELPNTHLLSILTQSFLFFKYLWLWLLPNPAWMSVDMREPFATSFLSWPYTFGLIAYLTYPCIAVWLLLKQGKMGLLGFALLFPWILFLTEFSTVRIQEPFVLYRSYLWMPGLFAALPVVFGWLAPRKACPELSRRGFILLGVVCLLLIPLTLNRLNTFSASLLLWDDAEKLVRNKPNVFGVDRIYYNRGTELGQLKRYEEAIADFSMAIAIVPLDIEYGNRATAYYFLGKHQQALRDFDRAIALNPDNANSYYGRAMTYRTLGDFTAAQDDLRKSCALGLCPQD